MNIYNNSTIGTNTYPTNATFTSVETTSLQIDSTFIIQGAQKGGILVCEDNNNDIGQIDIGLQNMVLASDANNTGLPIWTNSVTLNTGTFNGLNLVGVANGDLLVGSGTNSIGRLPIGLDDQVLFSNGTTVGWQSLSALNNYLFFAGSGGNIPTSTGVIYTNSSIGLTANRRYKISVAGQLTTTALVQLTVSIPSIFARNGTYDGDGDVSIMFIYIPASTGALTLQISGQVTPGNTATLSQTYITVEEF